MSSLTRTCRGHERRQKRAGRRLRNNCVSFLRIVDGSAINRQCGAPFVTVHISTASAVQHGFDAAQRCINHAVSTRPARVEFGRHNADMEIECQRAEAQVYGGGTAPPGSQRSFLRKRRLTKSKPLVGLTLA